LHRDPGTLALGALGWVLGEEVRAQRFLDLTGLSPERLRQTIGEPATHRAVLDYLAAHEPDLIAAAEHLQVDPEILIRARKELDL